MGIVKNRFYGWINLAGLMLTYGSLCGTVTYAYGVFLPFMGEAFDWSRSTLSGPYTVFFIITGLLSPIAGITISKFGARINILLCNMVVVVGLFAMSKVDAIWHAYVFFGIMGGIGLAFGEFIPVTTVINNWFIRKRSLAMALLFTSGGLAGFAMPPIISWLILTFGWRSAWVFLAAIHLIFTVISGGIIRSRPEDMKQMPDGVAEEKTKLNEKHIIPPKVYQTSVDWTAGEALRSRSLWMIVALFTIIIYVLNLMATHQVAYVTDIGFSPIVAATALGMMLGLSIIGRLLCGVLAMHFDNRILAACFLGSMGLGILSLMYAGNMLTLYLYSTLTGIGIGGMIVLMPNMIGAYFGRSHYARILGWAAPVVTLISASSPSITGILHDLTGSYSIPFAISLILVLSGMMVALLLRPDSSPSMKADPDC